MNIQSESFELQEIHFQAAQQFVLHLKKLIQKHKSDSIQIAQRDLYKDFVYPEKLQDHWSYYGKSSQNSIGEPHECASELGLIKIDTSTKPHTYTLTNITPLRPYQRSIVNQVKGFKGSVLIEAPTGAGKSVIACEVAKNEIKNGGKVLIVAPKIILLEQLRQTFTTLEPQIIHGPKDYDPLHNVFISTLQTAYKRELGFEPTMIIIDEVHFGFSGKMIEKLLTDFNNQVIGLSATPYDQNSKPIEGFDKHIAEFDLNYMLEHDYLVRPICYAPVKVDLSNISVQAGDYNQNELDVKFNNFAYIEQIVKNTKDIITQRNAALIFCINISHAKAVAEAFNEAGISTKAIHSQLSKKDQDEIMEEYRTGKIKMLANPMMLTTGFDNPATDCIVLARATKSQNLYRQMVGRGLRLFEGKTDAKIIDCAGVIDNLGLPTEPRKPNSIPLSKRVNLCPQCESTRIYRTKKQDWMGSSIIKKCADCGYSEDIAEQGCECEHCGAISGSQAHYFVKENALYLECSECYNHTLISTASSAEELREIFSEEHIKKIQQEHTMSYIKYLWKEGSVDLPFRDDVARHILAFQNYIAQNIPDFISNSFSDIQNRYKPFQDSRRDDVEIDEYDWLSPWNWQHKGRLFGSELEAQLLGTDVEMIKKQLEDTQDPFDVLDLVQKLYKSKGKPILGTQQHQQFREQLKNSTVENIDLLCSKRLKNIYHNNEPIEEILKFIPMMESIMGGGEYK